MERVSEEKEKSGKGKWERTVRGVAPPPGKLVDVLLLDLGTMSRVAVCQRKRVKEEGGLFGKGETNQRCWTTARRRKVRGYAPCGRVVERVLTIVGAAGGEENQEEERRDEEVEEVGGKSQRDGERGGTQQRLTE